MILVASSAVCLKLLVVASSTTATNKRCLLPKYFSLADLEFQDISIVKTVTSFPVTSMESCVKTTTSSPWQL